MSRKVLFVEDGLSYAVSHRWPLLQVVQSEGFDVHVAALTGGDTTALENEGFTCHVLSSGERSNNPLQEGRLLLRLIRLYRHLSPVLVHHITLRSVLYGGIASLFLPNARVVNGVTGLGYLFSSNGVGVRIVRSIVLCAVRILTLSERHVFTFQNPDDQRLFEERGVTSRNATYLIKGSGVDMDTFQKASPPSGVPIVLFPARMLWDKGVGAFVEAARSLQEDDVNARFVLVGTTDPKNPASVSSEQLERWDDEGVVEWWGYQEDMPDVLSRAAIVCLPSTYREGVPKVLIEAASCARPIVTTDVPGCREIVRDGENGLLVPPNTPEAVAEALRALLEDEGRAQQMGLRGREWVAQEFSDDRVVEETLTVYREVLADAL